MRKNLLMSGIEEVKGENCKTLASKVFKDKLKIEKEITIKNAFRIGKGDNRPIAIKLAENSDKGVIFKSVNKLRKSEDANDRKVFINDQLLEILAEEQIKQRQIVKYNRSLIAA